jgi:hypothetical protein
MRIGSDGLSAPAPSLTGWNGTVQPEAGQPLGTQDGSENEALVQTGDPSRQTPGTRQDSLELSPEALQQLAKLNARDQDVRAHEAAHMAAGGSLVRGGATYTYQQGPDGKSYAIGGEVTLDTSPVPNNPQATLAKAEQIEAAALAPADPSGQDHAVAAQAAAMASQAAAALARKQSSSTLSSDSSDLGKASPSVSQALGFKLDVVG